jgi:hypothetical protein
MIHKYSGLVIGLLILLLNTSLWGDNRYTTVYEPDRSYLTRGTLLIKGSSELLNSVFLDFNSYTDWVLEGMTRESEIASSLPAFLVSINPVSDRDNPNLLEIEYDLNTFIKKRGLKAYFTTQWSIGDAGIIDTLSFEYTGSRNILKEASYVLFFTPLDEGIQIDFICKAKLSLLLDLFFSLKLYEKNIGYYIEGLSDNLKKKLENHP